MKKPEEMKKVAVYGAGVIGAGFAAYYALKGLQVAVIEISDAAIDAAKEKIAAAVDVYEKYQITTDKAELLSRITYTTDTAEALKDVDFVQENGPENADIKHQIIAMIESSLDPEVVIASSSTGMPATLIAEGAKHPERIIVAHPFNPSYLIPLIEICKGEKTEEKYVQQAVAFYKYYDKSPIVLQIEKTGFVANRLAHALWREEVALVMEGVCSLEEADEAICYGPGLRWGIMGPALGYELGAGNLGLGGMIEKFSDTSNAIFKDISTIDHVPEDFAEVAKKQMDPYKEQLPDHIGHTIPEITAFRDDMLIQMLKMHKKL